MNRIDKVVVFRSLKEHHLRQILDLELQAVQDRIMQSAGTKFVFQCSETAKDMLMKEGLDYKYGARHLKRAVERFLGVPAFEPRGHGPDRFGRSVHVDVDGYSQPSDLLEELRRRANSRDGGRTRTRTKVQVKRCLVVLDCRSRRRRKRLRRVTAAERK